MSFFNSLNGGLDSFFKELSKSKRLEENRRERQFKELEYTPFLFSSGYLNELVEEADKEECESILDHLYRHDVTDIDSYKSIEKKIIDRLW